MRWLLVLLLLATTALADPVIESKQVLHAGSSGELLVGYQFKTGSTGPDGIVYSFIDDYTPGTSYTAFQFSDYGATRADSLQLRMDATWGTGHFSVSPIVGDSFILVLPGRSNVSVKRYNIFTNAVEDSANYDFYDGDELLAQAMYVNDTTVIIAGRNYTTAGVNPFWGIAYDKGATFALGGGPIAPLASLSGDANMRVGITRNGDSTVVGFFYQPNAIYSAIFNYGDYWPNAFVDTIAASTDDAGYSAVGAWTSNSTDHYVGFNYVDGFDDIALNGLTLRFTGVSIPQGAVIDSAFIGLTCQGIVGGGDSLYIRAEDTADATSFSSEADATSSRAWGATSAARTTSLDIDTAAIVQYTDDISSCIQMVVDRADWASGNDLALRIDGLTLSAGEDHLLRIRSGDYTGTASDPRLIVYYHDPASAWDNFGADSLVFTSALLKRKMSMTTSLDGGTYLSCSDTAGYIMVACKDSGAADFRIDTVSVLSSVPFEANNGPITALTCDRWTNKVTLAYTDADSVICIKQYDPATQTWDADSTRLATGQVQNIAGFNTTDPSFGARWLFSYRRVVAADTCFTITLVDSAATEWGAAPANTGRIIIIGN